jgi:hypothetical protein
MAGARLILMPSKSAIQGSSDHELPVVDEAGVDLTVIRAYLALTPIERLRSLQNAVRAVQKFKRLANGAP